MKFKIFVCKTYNISLPFPLIDSCLCRPPFIRYCRKAPPLLIQSYVFFPIPNTCKPYGTLCDYQPYFYYDNVNPHFNNLNIFPCMFITGQSAISCSSNLKEGILFTNEKIVELLKNRFNEILKDTSPLTQKFATGLTMLFMTLPALLRKTKCSAPLTKSRISPDRHQAVHFTRFFRNMIFKI